MMERLKKLKINKKNTYLLNKQSLKKFDYYILIFLGIIFFNYYY